MASSGSAIRISDVSKFVMILLVGLLLEAVGVVLLSRGLKEVGEMERFSVSEVVRMVKAGATNPRILAGVAFEAAFFGILMFLLGRADVSLVWPLTSLGFVITTLAAKLYLHETVSPLRWAGVVLIVLGAGLISWSDQQKKMAATTSAAASISSGVGASPR